MYAAVIWDQKMYDASEVYQVNKLLKEIAVLECENAKSF